MMNMKPQVHAFFDEPTNTVSYVVVDEPTRTCAIVDSVLDYDAASGRTSTASAGEIINFVQEKNFQVQWILETHVHADHISAAPYLKDQVGGKTAIGKNVSAVQGVFGDVFNAEPDFLRDG